MVLVSTASAPTTTSTTVSVCGVNTIEAQWVGLLASWFGADVLGVLPELGGRSRVRVPHLFLAFPAYWALLLSPFCRAFGLQVGCEAWEVIRDLVHPPTSPACVSWDLLPSSFCRHRLPSRPGLCSLRPLPRRAFLSAWLPPVPLTGLCCPLTPWCPPSLLHCWPTARQTRFSVSCFTSLRRRAPGR